MAHGLFSYDRISQNVTVFYLGMAVGFDCAKSVYVPQSSSSVPLFWVAGALILKEFLAAKNPNDVLEKTKMELLGQMVGFSAGAWFITSLQMTPNTNKHRP